MNEPSSPTGGAAGGAFPPTHWSVVLNAAHNNTTRAHQALSRLCETYWFPLYALARRRGYSPEDAQDLTQAFFAQLIEHDWVARADRQKGRFRSFLLLAMNRFLLREWDKAHSLKRGGQVHLLPLQLDTAETRYALEPANTTTPEDAFEKQWVLTLLEEVLRQLREKYERAGKGALFDALKSCLVGSRETQPYAELAARLGMSEGAIKVAVHRLRDRYRDGITREVARTVGSPGEVELELRHLFHVLARG
ncbi:MAG: sigma-70 family RNA polymerase sigma factor [Verrucomicrobiota bacterium]|jgi:RNA polymerase sigma-70 factor (ECF subfamily)